MKVIYPDYSGGSIYNISQTVKNSLGLKATHAGIRFLKAPDKPISLVVLDGLGYELAISAGEIRGDTPYLTSVFPSITCTALTSLLSGQMPGEHGVLGDTTFLYRMGTIINNSTYSSIYSQNPGELSRYMPMRDAYGANNIINEATLAGKRCAVVCPEQWQNKELANLTASESGEHFYYNSMDNAFEQYRKAIGKDFDFIYFYLPYIDQASHKFGPHSAHTVDTAKKILKAVKSLSLECKNRYTSMITADHGHIKVRKTTRLDQGRHALSNLKVPPFGSARSFFLNIEDASKNDLERNHEGLLAYKATSKSVTKLLGSDTCLKKTLFNYIIASDSDVSFYYPPAVGSNDSAMIGDHGGLTEAEMLVPLIVIG
ncbi:MAG: alkaline phosphatase family protein [Thermoplasmata archaeon]